MGAHCRLLFPFWYSKIEGSSQYSLKYRPKLLAQRKRCLSHPECSFPSVLLRLLAPFTLFGSAGLSAFVSFVCFVCCCQDKSLIVSRPINDDQRTASKHQSKTKIKTKTTRPSHTQQEEETRCALYFSRCTAYLFTYL